MSSEKDTSSTAPSKGLELSTAARLLGKFRRLSRSKHTDGTVPSLDSTRGAYILTTERSVKPQTESALPSYQYKYTLIQPASDGIASKAFVKTFENEEDLTKLYGLINPSATPALDAASISEGFWDLLGPERRQERQKGWWIEIHERIPPKDTTVKTKDDSLPGQSETDAKKVDSEGKASNFTIDDGQAPTVYDVKIDDPVFGNAVCAEPHGSKLTSKGVSGHVVHESRYTDVVTKRTEREFDIRPLDQDTYQSIRADFAEWRRRKEAEEQAKALGEGEGSDQIDEGVAPREESQSIDGTLRHANFIGPTRITANFSDAKEQGWDFY